MADMSQPPYGIPMGRSIVSQLSYSRFPIMVHPGLALEPEPPNESALRRQPVAANSMFGLG